MSKRMHEEIQSDLLSFAAPKTAQSDSLFLGFAFPKQRFYWFFVFFACMLLVLVVKAFTLQVVQHEHYQALAERNRVRHVYVWPKRGVIRDRQGVVLADNVPRFQLLVRPHLLPLNQAEREHLIQKLSHVFAMSVKDASALFPDEDAEDESYVLVEQVTYEQALMVSLLLPDYPALHLETRAKRRYPHSADVSSLAHLLGYVGKINPEEYQANKDNGYKRSDDIGKTGLERSYESVLRGTIGDEVQEVDSRGRFVSILGRTAAVDGQDVSLTVDLDLQRFSEQALKKSMQTAEVTKGAVVVMDPRDGSILSMVSLPGYNNNFFSGGVSSTVYQKLLNDPDKPLIARAFAGRYPSGSTVKIVVALAALQEGVVQATTKVLSNGGLRIGQNFFPDWKPGGHGVVDVRSAIAWSVNTFFYTVGGGYQAFVGMGVEKLASWYRAFGLGSVTGLDLPHETDGFVPDPEWKLEQKKERWFVGDTYNVSIGQGDLLVTPLQVARYTAAIANGGKLVQPHLAKQATSTVQNVSKAVDSKNVETVRLGMRDGVVYGSGRALSILPFAAAGKTGTAQWRNDRKTHAWFTAFAPFEKPEVVVTVLLEEGGEGSAVAVPVAKDILEYWWNMRNRRNGRF